MPAAFLSLVGKQPSATAVALQTWVALGRVWPERVCLVPTAGTRGTKGECERLASWLRGAATRDRRVPPQLDVIAVADDAIVESIAAWERQLDPGVELVFAADAGRVQHVAHLAWLLRARATILHADSDELHVQPPMPTGVPRRHRLTDLGFDQLLALYDVSADEQPGAQFHRRESRALEDAFDGVSPAEFRRHVRLDRRVFFDAALERRGRLFGLRIITGLQGARDLAAAQERGIKGLLPMVIGLTYSAEWRDQLSWLGVHAIDPAKGVRKAINAWSSDLTPQLGRAVMSSELAGSPLVPAIPKSVVRSDPATGDGPPLIVAMGTLPAATLTSLFTHAPRRAWIVVDSESPSVVTNSHRLASAARQGLLPPAELDFVSSDRFGTGLDSWAQSQREAILNARVDVTPGTKAQSVSLARLEIGETWCIDQPGGRARPLLDETANGIPIEAPWLRTTLELVQASAFERVPRSDDCLQRIAIFLRDAAGAGVLSSTFENEDLRVGHRTLSLQRPAKGKGLFRVVVRDGGEEEELEQRVKHAGDLFERLVADALVRTGAREVVREVRWQYSAPVQEQVRKRLYATGNRREPHMVDLDVASSFGRRHLAVSCKVGDNINQGQVSREVEAICAAAFGRLGLPMLARSMGITPRSATGGLRTTDGALVVGLDLLAEPLLLREALDRAIHERS